MKLITSEFENQKPTGNLYQGDVLGNRFQFGSNLVSLIEQIDDGGVISIDAPWGEGKSRFINWWKQHLERDEFTVTILDAFEHDFQGDAFMAIFPKLEELFTNYKNTLSDVTEETKVTITRAFNAFVEKGSPILSGTLATIALGNPIAGKAIADVMKATVAGIFSKQPQNTLHSELMEFRAALSEFANTVFTETDKPFIFIIDELDRCRPDFAVEVLEKLKHFFTVPGIIWVLSVNLDQLADSIQHIYGNKKPHLYFEKFIHIQTTLPKNDKERGHIGNPLKNSHYLNMIQGITSNIFDKTQVHETLCVLFEKWFFVNLSGKFGVSY